MSRPARLAKGLATSLVVLLALLLIGEVAVRLFTDTEHPVVMRDPVVGRRFLKSFKGDVFDPEAERKIPVRFNALGFRGPEWSQEPEPGVRRVAVLGDSMIAGMYLEEADTFVGQLEAMLQASHPSDRWQVMNFGVPGSSTAQELVAYREIVRDYAPELVLCGFFSGNDLADNSKRLTSNPRIYFDIDENDELVRLPFSVRRASVSTWLNLHSRLYVWQKQMLDSGSVAKASSFSPARWIYCTNPDEDVEHAWRVTSRLLVELSRSVVEDEHDFAIIALPSAIQIYSDRFEADVLMSHGSDKRFDWDEPDARLRALADANGISLLSLTSTLRAAAPDSDSENLEERLYYRGHGHWNGRANELAARAVHEFLAR